MMTTRRDDPDGFDAKGLRNRPNGGPWWTRWGLVGVLVLGMLAVTTGIVPSALTQTKQAVEENRKDIKEHRQKEEDLRREISQRMEDNAKILRAICVSVARNEEARERCLR